MWKRLAVAAAAFVALLLAVVALQPSSFVVERSAAIEAPPVIVYSHIHSLRAMDRWSPFARMDPEMRW